jgi:Flp pilus assembly protein TadG
MTRLRNEQRGQAILVTVLFLTVLIGATALTLDVGSWYRQQRQAQGTADAAALAAAQALPSVDTTEAYALAKQYAAKNGGGLDPEGVFISTGFMTNDTVRVAVTQQADGIFASLFTIRKVDVRASAAARAGTPEQVEGAAPIVVNRKHPLLAGPGCPCFKVETTLPLDKQGAPGAFGMVDFDNSGSNGNPDLATWIADGYPKFLKLGPYDSAPGAKFNGTGITEALDKRVAGELLFPVFDRLDDTGSTAQYNIIGWVAFHLDCFGLQVGVTNCAGQNGNSQTLTGYFTRVIWRGLQSKSNKNLPDFGVYSVSLVK